MPCWYWDKKDIECNTPSIQDGLDHFTECQYRKEGARFILDIGMRMDLVINTLATGIVFFHRFYMFHSFKTFPTNVTACCCLYLAGKVEETPKRCKDIIRIAKSMLSEEKFATFGENPLEEVMALERILLQTIKFDLEVQHPYTYLKEYIKYIRGTKEVIQEVLQMSWNFINDSLCTTLSVEWEPEIIAIAVLYLARRVSKFKGLNWTFKHTNHVNWWDLFVEDLSTNVLEDICHQIVDLYSPEDEKRKRNTSQVMQVTKSIDTKLQPTVSCTVTTISFTTTTLTKPVNTESTATVNYFQTADVPDIIKAAVPWTPISSSSNVSSENIALGPPENLNMPPPNFKPLNDQSTSNDVPIMSQNFHTFSSMSAVDNVGYNSSKNNITVVSHSSDTFRRKNRFNSLHEYSMNQNYHPQKDNFKQNQKNIY